MIVLQKLKNNIPLEAETFLNVSYGVHAQQVYDLYLPANRSTSKTKVIILVHGGGWSEGDKEEMDGFVSLIQENHPDYAIVKHQLCISNFNYEGFSKPIFRFRTRNFKTYV